MCECTRFNFEDVFRMPAVEFLGYCKYVDYKNRRRQAEADRLKGKTRIA